MSHFEDLDSSSGDRVGNESQQVSDFAPSAFSDGMQAKAVLRRTPSQTMPPLTNTVSEQLFAGEISPRTRGDREKVVNRAKTSQHKKASSLGQHTSVVEEIPNMILLITLYMLQGVPLGMTMGTIPMLLAANNKGSYTQIGLFSLATYPYSFKLLWSPIVDSIYSSSFGRRKSWLVPLQLLSAAVMFVFAPYIDAHITMANVPMVTALFFILVLLAATQDIAVDGWALTLLSRRHVGYASTCQTIGMNFGYFCSITMFLALNDASFCNRFLRSPQTPLPTGMVSLTDYMRFWSLVYCLVTFAVWFLISEKPPSDEPDSSKSLYELKTAYGHLMGVLKLPAVLRFSVTLVTWRLAFICAESVASLKLIEKGVAKDTVAALVLFQFPVELCAAVLAGKWSASGSPFTPWKIGYVIRILAGFAMTTVVMLFPTGKANFSDSPMAFLAFLCVCLMTWFSSMLMFTCMGTFFNRISDPAMGGAYVTMLNTILNCGIVLPQAGIYALVDMLSYNVCEDPVGGSELMDFTCPRNTQAASQDSECSRMGGRCRTVQDGFYITSYIALAIGIPMLFYYQRDLPRTEALPADAWRSKTINRQL